MYLLLWILSGYFFIPKAGPIIYIMRLSKIKTIIYGLYVTRMHTLITLGILQ